MSPELHAVGLAAAALAALTAALGLHPFITYPLSLHLLPRKPVRPQAGAHLPSVAMCICAYNEEAVIAARVENMLALRRHLPALDILVYVDAASDNTAHILAPYADRIRLVVSTERAGKTAGMNTLVAMTQADIVVFSDANVAFADDALEHLLAPFADPAIGCVCGHLCYLEQQGATRTAATGSLYWRLEEHIKGLESDTGSVMGADGSIFAIRRALHAAAPPHLIDDMFLSFWILCRGARIVRVKQAMAYEAAVSCPAEEYRRKTRIACQAFNVNRALWPQLVRLPAIDLYKYVSHKLLRWLCIFLLGTAALLGCAAVFLLGGTAAGLIVSCAGLAAAASIAMAKGGWRVKVREILAALAATGLGVLRSCRGHMFQTWNPPQSARAMASPVVGLPEGMAAQP